MLLRRGASVRTFADDAAASAASGASAADASGESSRRAFLEKFAPLVSSTTAPPSFPTDFLPKEKADEAGAAAVGVPDKLKFSFYLPHGQPVDRQPVRFVLAKKNCGGDALERETSDALPCLFAHEAALCPLRSFRRRIEHSVVLRKGAQRERKTWCLLVERAGKKRTRFFAFLLDGASSSSSRRPSSLLSTSSLALCSMSCYICSLSPPQSQERLDVLADERERKEERRRRAEDFEEEGSKKRLSLPFLLRHRPLSPSPSSTSTSTSNILNFLNPNEQTKPYRSTSSSSPPSRETSASCPATSPPSPSSAPG